MDAHSADQLTRSCLLLLMCARVRMPCHWNTLTIRPRGVLASKHSLLRSAVAANQAFCHAIIASQTFGPGADDAGVGATVGGSRSVPVVMPFAGSLEALPHTTASPHQYPKVQTCLHQCVRDWSEEGKVERDLSYGPLLQELQTHLPVTPANRNQQRVLVPGAGIGRLAFEVACRGYATQGNEFSYHMLMTGSYIMNRLAGTKSAVIHPWIDQSSNTVSHVDMLRAVQLPDVNPSEMMACKCCGMGP